MKDKFPNLKWVVVMRHARYGQGDMPTPESKAFIKDRLAHAMRKKILVGFNQVFILTSLEFRGVVTGNYFSNYLGMLNTLGIRELGIDRYSHGTKLINHISDALPEQTQVAIIIGHFEAVPGIADAIVAPFGKSVPCFEPSYLDGVIIDMETGEHHVGINEFFGVEPG